ncbi:MAG: hypothetical protein H7269_15155 [Cellulomonas sp.]|nr:hypothetical protein [Cellulomonas sp.]
MLAYDLPVRRDGSRGTDFVTAGTTPLGAGAWLSIVPSTFVVRAGTETPVHVRVAVPANAEGGDHLAGVRYVVGPTDESGAVSVRFAIDTFYFVQVGAIARRDLDVSVRPLDRLHWRGGSIAWAVTVRNRGNVHETITGQLRVDGYVGSVPTQRLRGGILLPGESRTERVTASVRDAPDVLKATATVLHGGVSDAPVRSTSRAKAIFVAPWWLLALIVAALALVWWRLASRPRASSAEDAMPIAIL